MALYRRHDLWCSWWNRWFRIHRTVCYYLELRGWCGRCRIPGFSSYDLWTVEAVPDRSCGCVLAVFRSLANIADSTVLSTLGWSKNIYSMMPFIASMIILAFTSKNSQAPKAEGIPYDKGAR